MAAPKKTGETKYYGAGGAETLIDPAVYGEDRLAEDLATGRLLEKAPKDEPAAEPAAPEPDED